MSARDVIAAAIDEFMVHPLEMFVAAENVLTALKSEGWELYRPEECVHAKPVGLQTQQSGQHASLRVLDSSPGPMPSGPWTLTYRLVPVPDEEAE